MPGVGDLQRGQMLEIAVHGIRKPAKSLPSVSWRERSPEAPSDHSLFDGDFGLIETDMAMSP
jgi:hypothetical protein